MSLIPVLFYIFVIATGIQILYYSSFSSFVFHKKDKQKKQNNFLFL